MDNPTSPLPVTGRQIHVWTVRLDLAFSRLAGWENILSEDERRRADRFALPDLKRRFIAARTTLRRVLAAQLGISPAQVNFQYSPKGKPSLSDGLNQSNLSFNLSHSADLALITVTRGGRIGVDLEVVHPLPELDHIAANQLTLPERAFLDSLPGQDRLEAFFSFWTCKEALMKAAGDGFSISMQAIEISFPPDGGNPRLRLVPENLAGAAGWSLYSFSPGKGFRAAIAVEGSDHQLMNYSFPETDPNAIPYP